MAVTIKLSGETHRELLGALIQALNLSAQAPEPAPVVVDSIKEGWDKLHRASGTPRPRRRKRHIKSPRFSLRCQWGEPGLDVCGKVFRGTKNRKFCSEHVLASRTASLLKHHNSGKKGKARG